MPVTRSAPIPTPFSADTDGVGLPAEMSCYQELLGCISCCGDLFDVLEVVAPYDLAYVPTLDAATGSFEQFTHKPVTLTHPHRG